MTTERRGMLLLLTGPAGAGKSTVANAWCARRDKALHLQLDDVRSLVVAGYADPQEPGDAQTEQYELAAVACIKLARHYIEHGYDAVIDDVFSSELFERVWKPHLEAVDWRVVVLRPSLNETLRRGGARGKRVKREIVTDQHGATALWPHQLTIDSTHLSVGETVERIDALLTASPSE